MDTRRVGYAEDKIEEAKCRTNNTERKPKKSQRSEEEMNSTADMVGLTIITDRGAASLSALYDGRLHCACRSAS
jgi:hypothetical protein